jgi:hypothetical protein
LTSNFLVVFVVIRKHSAQEKIGDNSERPQVDLLAVRLLQKHLRRNVGESSKWIETGLVWPDDLRETEVDNLEISIVIVAAHQDVLWFEVAMGNSVRVQVVDGGGDLV